MRDQPTLEMPEGLRVHTSPNPSELPLDEPRHRPKRLAPHSRPSFRRPKPTWAQSGRRPTAEESNEEVWHGQDPPHEPGAEDAPVAPSGRGVGRRGRHRHVLRVLGDDVNAGNTFDAGTVVDLRQRRRTPRCTTSRTAEARRSRSCGASEVTYTGSLDSTVSLYASAVGRDRAVRQPHDRQGHRHGRVPDCTGFTSEAQHLHAGRSAASPPRTPTSATASVGRSRRADACGTQNDTLVYRFTLTLQDDARGQRPGRRATHSFTWEAQNV